MTYEREKEAALQAVLAAARLCEQVRRDSLLEAVEKKDRSPVTIADFGSQAVICRALAEAFPNDPVVAEEDSADLRGPAMAGYRARVVAYVQAATPEATPDQVMAWIDRGNGQVGPRCWTLDPIDGTKGFLRGGHYAVALALIEGGEVKVGVLACPALPVDAFQPDAECGVLFAAVSGRGTSQVPFTGGEAQPVRVSGSGDEANLRFVESVEAGHGDHSRQEAIAAAVGITTPPLRMDSQAKYGAVARGQATLYLRLPSPKTPDYREKIWDHAAGKLIVEEAGGQVTDMHGRPLDFSLGSRLVDNRGVVVSNGAVHDTVLAALRKTMSDSSG